MVELVLLFCLTKDSTTCVERRTPIDAALPMACMIAAQQQAAAYIEEHPKYRVARMGCEVGSHKGVPA
jgi:hypothetical protein